MLEFYGTINLLHKPEYLEDNVVKIVLQEVADDVLRLTTVRAPVPHHVDM